MVKNEISLEGLPKEIKDKIIAVLGQDTLPVKKVTIQEVLPELDLPQDKKDEILRLLNPESKQEAKNHERLEKLMQKNRSKPNINRSLETIRQGLDEKRKHKS